MSENDNGSPQSVPNSVDEVEEVLEKIEINEDEKPIDDDYIDIVALKDLEVNLTNEELEIRKQEALQCKEEGNEMFKSESYVQARAKYTAALRLCPLAYPLDRAIFYANRAATNKKEGRLKEAIDDCTSALELNPTYFKVLKRRAEVYEEDEKLDESFEDYKKILELDPRDEQARTAVQRLPDKINARNEKLKEQMMGTLKDLGNKILKPFGLSTDNFKLQQEGDSGGYTINFSQNKT